MTNERQTSGGLITGENFQATSKLRNDWKVTSAAIKSKAKLRMQEKENCIPLHDARCHSERDFCVRYVPSSCDEWVVGTC